MKNLDLCRCTELMRVAGNALVSIADLIDATCAAEVPSAAIVKAVAKEEVRAVLAAKTSAGYGKEIRALLGQFGATQLSDIKPEAYAELMEAAKRIGTEAQNG